MTMLGVYVGNSVSEVRQFETWLGREADAVLAYVGRNNWTDFEQSADWAAKFWAGVDRPVLWSVPLVVNGASLAAAANGDYNAYYREVAETLAATRPGDETITIRTGWEMNGQWFPWSVHGGKEADFVGAWRQFVDVFRSVSDRFQFDWCPNIGDLGVDPAKSYPGDDYVDIIGMDFYHDTRWDPKDPEVAWDFMVDRAYGLQWHQDFASSHGKPTAYSEWGVNTDIVGPFVEHMADWVAAHDVVYHTYWNSYADYAGKLSDGNNPTTGAEFRQEFGGEPLSIVTGTDGADLLAGTDRGERFEGGAGTDTMRGGKGDDTYTVAQAGDVVVELAGEGTDDVRSQRASYTLPDNVEHLNLILQPGQTGQAGIGNALANRIVGGAGDDTLDGGVGDDYLMGGSGKDTFVIRKGTGRETIADFAAGNGAGDVLRLDGFGLTWSQVKASLEQYGSDTILTLPTGEVVVFASRAVAQFAADDFAFTGTPPAPPPVWRPDAPLQAPTPVQVSKTGGSGNDALTGDDRNDYLNGNAGIDTLTGGKGHDVYVVDQPGDVIVEKPGEGIDRVESWAKSYVLPDTVEHIALLGSYAQSVTGNALANRISGGGGNDTIDGKAGNDWLTGKGGNDTFVILRGAGHDTITDIAAGSGAGDVVRLDSYGLTGFTQVKPLLSQQGADTLLTLPGGDTVLFLGRLVADFVADDFVFAATLPGTPVDPTPVDPTPVDPTPTPPVAEPALPPAGSPWYRKGTAGNDTIAGNDGSDKIDGGGGIDTMAGGKGHDIYVVDQTGDGVIEQADQGIDTVQSWAKSFTLTANVEHIELLASYEQSATGNALANRLTGGSGANVLNGGAGNDWLKGGGGADTFVFQKGTGQDIVADFVSGTDKVKLDGYGFGAFDQVKALLVQQGADTVLHLPDGDAVVFRGTTVAQVQAADVQFAGPVMAPPSSGPASTVTVRASAESWNGDPVFRLLVDGHQVGADTRVKVQHGDGWQDFTFTADTAAPGTVAVRFANDAYGNGPAQDRNLWVDHIVVNGVTVQAETALYDRDSGPDSTGLQKMAHAATLVFDFAEA